ncbi:MAG: SDR family oxidoreductase [Planctomycetia bacterium]|nr:SDR family oxidoreductase [Planctomycetia bacterium]
MSTTTDKNTSPYILMTGATGLLGSYLVRDLLMSGRRLALIVRRDRKKTPASRMELLLRHWDETLGYTLPRPIVLEGDLSQPLCGLDNDARSWVTSNCDALLNNAASLSFRGSDPTAEPWLTNVTGTTNVLALAKETGLRQMHHVSTAYVCGLRTGRVLESDVDVGQEFGNDYEKSKVASEQLVRSAEHFDTATIYRPSIIAGDSQTGYTSTYHGLFAALRLGHTLLTRVVKGSTSGPALLALIGVDPKAHKNFVPVDWVSSVISHLIQTPSAHGKTFHVTHPAPCSMDLVGRFIQEAVERYSKDASPDDPDLCDEQWFADTMLTQLDVYTSYFRHDPTFDQTNVTAFASHLPCPVLDMPRLLTMARFAIANDFGRLSVKIPATAPELTCNASLPQEVSDETQIMADANQMMANANQGACLNVPFAPADSI